MTEEREVVESEELTLETLEADGDLAADYLEGLLDIADLDGDLDITVENGRAYVSVTGGGVSIDKIANPDTVQALQDLTSSPCRRRPDASRGSSSMSPAPA